MVAAIIVLSLIPVEVDLGEDRDKLAHFVAYGSLSFWFGMIFGGRGPQLGIALAFAAMGAALEFLQGLTDYRSFEVADMIANAVGAGLGWCLVQTPLRNALTWLERWFAAAAGKRNRRSA
jgi:VanZ family protein